MRYLFEELQAMTPDELFDIGFTHDDAADVYGDPYWEAEHGAADPLEHDAHEAVSKFCHPWRATWKHDTREDD